MIWYPVIWSETVGLRTRQVWDQTKSVLVLVLHVWCCVRISETRSYHVRRRNDLEGHSNFSSTIYSIIIHTYIHT